MDWGIPLWEHGLFACFLMLNRKKDFLTLGIPYSPHSAEGQFLFSGRSLTYVHYHRITGKD